MRARCLLRLCRPHDILRPDFTEQLQSVSGPERAVALSLLAAAFRRCGMMEQAKAELLRAEIIAAEFGDCDAMDEIHLARASVFWSESDLEGCEKELAVPLASLNTIICCQAIAIQSWIHAARYDFKNHALLLRKAWDELACGEIDVYLQASIVHGLSVVAREQYTQSDEMETATAAAVVAWTPEVSLQHALTLRNLGWAAAAAGDIPRAFRRFREARCVAEAPEVKAHALLDCARLKIETMQSADAIDNIDEAETLVRNVDWMTVGGDERTVLLTFAELLAPVNVEKAVHYLELYCERPVKFYPTLIFSTSDKRRVALERFTAGVVYRHLDREQDAYLCLRDAFIAWNEIWYKIRAARAAFALSQVSPSFQFFEYPVVIARDFYPKIWFTPQLDKMEAFATDPIVQELSAAQLQILKPLLAGKSTKQIASEVGKAETSVRNGISEIFRVFGVNRRPELLTACAARGLI